MPDRLSATATTLIYAGCAAVWIVASGTVLFVAVSDPLLQSQIEIAKGLSFVVVSSGVLYILLRVRRDTARAAIPQELLAPSRSPLKRLLLVPGILVLIVPLVGFAVYFLYAQTLERTALQELRGIATLKSQQIETWLAERRGDATSIARSQGFAERVVAMQSGADAHERELVDNRLAAMRDAFAYEGIALLDSEGALLVAVGEQALDDADAALAERARTTGMVQMGEMYRGPSGRMHFCFAAPLIDERVPRAPGTVLACANPENSLFPLVRSWPTASATGRAWLVRREGEQALLLNDESRDDGTRQVSERLLSDVRHPALAALGASDAGTMRGVDESGATVLSAWRAVPGTGWRLVAAIERSEALAIARTTALWASAVALFGVLMVAAAILLLLRQQRMARHLALQVQADRLLKHFYELPFVGMAITSPQTGRWLQFNDHLCTIFGYTRQELGAMSWMEMTHPEDVDIERADFRSVLSGKIEGYALDKRFIRKDGSVLFASTDVKCVRQPDGTVGYLVAVVRDISARVATQDRILKLGRLYHTLSRCNAAIVHCASEQALFEEVCEATVQSGGAALGWIGLVDPLTGIVQPRASAGAGAGAGVGYLRGLTISVHADDPTGGGPTGTAIREGEPVWCQDFRTDPRTEPWRQPGEAFGLRASAALPIRRRGVPIGALSIYMPEVDAFDDETRALLIEIAKAVSFGLDNLDRESARRDAEQDLRESEARYRLLFDNSQDAILLTAPDGAILAANPAACRIFGASEAQLHSAGRDGVIDPADPRVERALAQRAESGSFSGELTMRRLDGGSFPAEVSSALFTERDGQLRSSIIIRDITERKRAEEQLTYLAQHDALTALPNRLLLMDRLSMALAGARRNAKRLAVMFMDLDRFKIVNDSFGHDLGDRLLREAAIRLSENVRATDTVSRHGGDEFLVILPEIERDADAALVAGKLIDAFSRPFVLDETEIVLTASIGIVCYPDNGRDADTLLRNADAAMYVAKDQGRNRYQFYSKEMNARSHERMMLESDLRHAIAREQLSLVYQPQVDLGNGVIVGLEAFVRWQHPVRGEVPPAQFIPIAEESGLIESVGSWVLETACAQHARWVSSKLITGPVAVNVSAYQFRQADFVGVVQAVLTRCGLPASLLELELTEGMVMRGGDEVLHKLDALHALGVNIAIDDFGTGYSSLSYLTRFPIGRLKIDQSFTRGLPGDRGSAAIAQAVISMGHSLGLDVVAEGVENKAQQEFLQSLWCDAGQGYLYARPLSAQACTDFLRARVGSAPARAGPAGH